MSALAVPSAYIKLCVTTRNKNVSDCFVGVGLSDITIFSVIYFFKNILLDFDFSQLT